MSNPVINFCSIYNRHLTEKDVVNYIKSELNLEHLNRDLDYVICMNVITRDKERAFCIFQIVTELKTRNQVSIYRWPSNGNRKKITNLSDWCEEVETTIYKNLAIEVRKLLQ